MLTIGAHLSASKGYTAMLKQAVEIGANTFQFFTRNPRGGSATVSYTHLTLPTKLEV